MSNAILDMPEGRLADFLNWWLVLRAALDGRRIHAPGDVVLDVALPRSFGTDDSDEDMRAFLEEAGYLHIRGLFTEEEMAAVEADYPKAAPRYAKGDPLAWFATTQDGVEHLVRMEGFDRYSDALAELLDDERLQRIRRLPGLGHVSRNKPGMRAGGLTKPIGVVKGISDVPWHKDCSLGRHSYECCSLTVGISVNGADATSGQLRVVPGSHRALVWPSPCLQPGLDLAPLDLPTRTGDVTVHLSCTLHMSQPPVTRPRKVVYTGFALPPVDADAAEANRRRLNAVRSRTHTSVSQEPGYLGR
jgi:Phytanoyl-CoA dioxygenase (PhyH)